MVFVLDEICEDLLKDLSKRQKQIVVRRFGLGSDEKKESLQSIGDDFGITRERIRQLQNNGLLGLREKVKDYPGLLQFFHNQLKTTGELRKEDILLKTISPESENRAFFLLFISGQFDRFLETEDLYTLWTTNKESLAIADRVINFFLEKLEEIAEPVETKDIERLSSTDFSLPLSALLAFLEISKKIERSPDGLWGISKWPEVSPRGMKDGAYFVLKRTRKPLHFREISELINEYKVFRNSRTALPQTVHNELIKDSRFVLVGRGIYALSEWGYNPGLVKDVIVEILKEKSSLGKEELIEEVLKKRFVKRNTVGLNLKDKKYFQEDAEGNYRLKKG